MKKLIILFGALFCCSISYAQTIYTDGAIISADSIPYEVIRDNRFFFALKNIENEYSEQPIVDLENKEVDPFMVEMGELSESSLYKAVFETFTKEEIENFSNNRTILTVYLTKNNVGELLEVAFMVRATPLTLSMPPEKFAAFEKNLKKYLRWTTVTEDEKKLKFMHESLRVPFAALADVRVIEPNPEAERVPDSLKVVGVN